MTEPIEPLVKEPGDTLYCTYHPNRPTTLRCNRCEKPICAQCAVLTPTGYRCKECVRGHQKVFENAQALDYILGVVVGLILSFLGSLIASAFGFFTLFIAPVAGVVIAEGVRYVTHRRRSRMLYRAVTAAVVVGGSAVLLNTLLGFLVSGSFGSIFGLIFQGIYVAMATSTMYYRLSGIQIR